MTRRTLMLLAASAMAALLAGCGGTAQGDGSHQASSSSHQASSSSQKGSSQQTTEPATNETSVGRCADKGSTVGQQQEASGSEASNGKIAFSRSTFSRISESAAANTDIDLIDGKGAHETQLTYTKQFEDDPVWSPDGQKIAFIRSQSDLYVMNADGTKQTQLATYLFDTGGYTYFAWSPDGGKIAFIRGLSAPSDLYVVNADGTKEAHLTTSFSANSEDETQLGPPVWSPDGNKIAFASSTLTDTSASASGEPASAPAEGLSGIYLINVDGTGLRKLEAAVGLGNRLGVPIWSPDGNKIAFWDLGGAIDVINADGSGRKELTANANDPPQLAWSPDGKRIAFIDASLELHVINADGGGQRRLTNTPGPSFVASPTWSPDSEKIAYSCPFVSLIRSYTDLCVINADGTGMKRIASKVAPQGFAVAASWAR